MEQFNGLPFMAESYSVAFCDGLYGLLLIRPSQLYLITKHPAASLCLTEEKKKKWLEMAIPILRICIQSDGFSLRAEFLCDFSVLDKTPC